MARKKVKESKLRLEQGIWVLDTGTETISAEEVNRVIDGIRREREDIWLGPGFKAKKKRSTKDKR